MDIKEYPTDDILTDIRSAVSIERGLVRFRQIGHRVLSRAEETGMVAMLTENEVCYAAFLYANGLLNATKSLSVTKWLTFVAKAHYDHCTLSSKLFESNLHVLCTIPL